MDTEFEVIDVAVELPMGEFSMVDTVEFSSVFEVTMVEFSMVGMVEVTVITFVRATRIFVSGMPLSMIIAAQLSNPYGCQVLTLSMGATVAGSCQQSASHGSTLQDEDTALLHCDGKSVSMEDATKGNFRLMFLHPEACVTSTGQKLLGKLSDKDAIRGLVIDEIHMGLEGHWAGFRPGLLTNILSVRAYMVPGSSLAVLTATITAQELQMVKKLLDRKKEAVLLAEGPVKNNAKICTIRRPSSDVDFLGRKLSDGTWQPGMLALLETLFLTKYVRHVKDGTPCPRTMIFFRC